MPLGSSGSLRNMLDRSLGAGTLAGFWRYWNPIWGYYLGRYVYGPIRTRLPPALALVATFVVSGALHDAVASILTGRWVFIITPWFFILGTGVIIGNVIKLNYSGFAWPVRALINLGCVGGSLALTQAILRTLA